MNETTGAEYRARLIPFIKQWTERRTRVAIFGTGPHTDYLFSLVPELDGVRIVGFLDSHRPKQGRKYRRARIHPPSWAEGNADVILCSSFVNEASMAASVELLPCKVVPSHTPPSDASCAAPAGSPAPSPSLRISWPEPASVHPTFQVEAFREFYGQFAEYFESAEVLDAILRECFQFVAFAQYGVARVLLRYLLPGSTLLGFRTESGALTRLARLCAAPHGHVIMFQPRFAPDFGEPGAARERRVQARLSVLGMRKPRFASGCRLHHASEPEIEGNSDADVRRAAAFFRRRLHSDGKPGLLWIDDSRCGLRLIPELREALAAHPLNLLFRLEESRWSMLCRDVFHQLAETGYELRAVEDGYRKVDALHFDAGGRFGLVHVLAVRVALSKSGRIGDRQ